MVGTVDPTLNLDVQAYCFSPSQATGGNMTLSGRGEIGRQVSVLCVRRWRLTGSLAVRPLTWHGPVRCVIPLSRQDVGALNLRSLHCSGSSSGCAGQPTSPLRRNRPEPMKNRRAQTRRFARWSSTSVHAAQTREELAATARLDRWNKSKSESVDREKQPRHGHRLLPPWYPPTRRSPSCPPAVSSSWPPRPWPRDR